MRMCLGVRAALGLSAIFMSFGCSGLREPAPDIPLATVTKTIQPIVFTASPIFEVILASPTSNSAPTAQPTDTATPPPTITATLPGKSTPSPSPTPIQPVAAVQIQDPGPMSKLVSPVSVYASVRSVPRGSERIELWLEPLKDGEMPRLLVRTVRRFGANPALRVYISEDLTYELSRASELAQVKVSVYDEYERPVAVSSVDVLLLQQGTNDLNPSGDGFESLVITEPTANKLIQGGVVYVTGLAKPNHGPYLDLELVSRDGKVVGSKNFTVTPVADGKHVPFVVEVPYNIETTTWVRVTIKELDPRIPGIRQLNSVEVLLSP